MNQIGCILSSFRLVHCEYEKSWAVYQLINLGKCTEMSRLSGKNFHSLLSVNRASSFQLLTPFFICRVIKFRKNSF